MQYNCRTTATPHSTRAATPSSGTEKAPSAGAAHLCCFSAGSSRSTSRNTRASCKFEITRKTVKRKEVMHFSRQLGVFVEAGIPIMEALEVIAEETTDKLLKRVLLDMVAQLQAGDTFAAAAAVSSRRPFPVLRGRPRIGRTDRNLDKVLDELADYLETDIEARSASHVGTHLSRRRRGHGGRHGRRPGRLRAPTFQDILLIAQCQAAASDADAAGRLRVHQHAGGGPLRA